MGPVVFGTVAGVVLLVGLVVFGIMALVKSISKRS
jgi:hypothetical protein